jgi:hypothetical protein
LYSSNWSHQERRDKAGDGVEESVDEEAVLRGFNIWEKFDGILG